MNDTANKTAIYYVALAIINLILIGLIFAQDTIAQPDSYHAFSDQVMLFSLPNFWNVLSNLPYLFAGIMILRVSYSQHMKQLNTILLGASIFLVFFGSAYYHLAPSTERLFWDRLPIAIGFMALFNLFIQDYYGSRTARMTLFPKIMFAAIALLYWRYSELNGAGDMRAYLLVQIIPIITIVYTLAFNRQHSKTKAYAVLMFSYLIAKLFEFADGHQMEQFLLLSGHSWKHIVSGIGIILFCQMYFKHCQIKPKSSSVNG